VRGGLSVAERRSPSPLRKARASRRRAAPAAAAAPAARASGGGGALGDHVLAGLLETDVGSCSGVHRAQLERARQVWVNTGRVVTEPFQLPLESTLVHYIAHGHRLYRRPANSTSLFEIVPDWNLQVVEALLQSVLRNSPQPFDAEIFINYDESPQDRMPVQGDVPVFAFTTRHDGPSRLIGFPNPYFLCAAEKLQTQGRQARQMPWASKKNDVFWRGTLTAPDGLTSEREVAKLARVHLAEIAAGAPNIFDVEFVGLDDTARIGEDARRALWDTWKNVRHGPKVDFFTTLPEHKYLVNVEGTTASWRGLPLLAAGSVMLLQYSEVSEFFWEDLVPWVHYVPVAHDLSDLNEKLSYLRSHDDLAALVAQSGQEFANVNLTLPAIECYATQSLQLMVDVMRTHTLPSRIEGFEEVPQRSFDDACA